MPIQAMFNAANLALSIGAGFAVSHAIAANQILVELAVTITVFEVLNTLSVSTVICLISGAPLSGIWRNCHLWSFPLYLCGAVLAAVWIQSDAALSISITVVGALTLYLMGTFYQELLQRAASAEPAATTTA